MCSYDTWKVYAHFATEVGRLMVLHGLRHESEAVLAKALHWPPTTSDKEKASKMIAWHLELLMQKFRDKFFEDVNDATARAKASAWYEVAYEGGHKDRSRRRCFAWIVYDVLYDMTHDVQTKGQKLHGRAQDSREAVCLMVGDGARAELREQLPWMQQVVASRLATLATVQHTLDLYCAKLCGKSDSFRLFSLHPFGSTALGLCEQESDLDVCAVVHPEAFEELIQRSDLAEFKRCTSQQQAKHFLRNVLSPALDAISVEKKEVLEARVPVLRLSLRQVLDTMDTDDEQRVDVTLSDEGLLKAEHFYKVLPASSPAAYGAIVLLTMWARAVGLVRSSSTEAFCAGAGEAVLVPGEWQALLLFIVKRDDALRQTIEACAGTCTVQTTEVQGRLAQLMDFAQVATREASADLGRLLYAFLAALRDLRDEALRFDWPISGCPFHELARGACKTVALYAKHASEILSLSRRVQTMLRACPGTSGASISRRLSRALSHRLFSHRAFHETYLRDVSGASVQLEVFEGSDVLYLSASGTRAQILELQRELRRYTTAALALGMPSTKASRYFMEGSTRLLFAGASNLKSRVRFVEAMGAYVPLHAACERMLPCLNTVDQTGSWQDLAMQRFLDLWTGQLAQLRANSPHLLDSLAVRVRFGTMYLIDVSTKLPETSATLSVDELEEAVVKNRRNRKTADRVAPEPVALEERSKPTGRPEMVFLKPTKGFATLPQKKGKREMRKRKQRGLGNTFCPGLLKDNQPSEAIQQQCLSWYCKALLDSGFELKDDADKHKQWTMAISASSSFEIDWRLDHSLRTVFINERPLCWVHATLVADRAGGKAEKPEKSDLLKAHDIRFKVETTEPIKTSSKWYDAVVSNTKPIRVNNGIPAVDSSASPWLRDRLGFVRRTDFRNEYRKQHAVPSGSLRMDAEVSQGEEFMGRDLGLRRKFCELSLKVQAEDVKMALEHGMLATRLVGETLWKTALEVSSHLSP
ncbi:unnamed protein product [Symbiodinium natans]|uniref:Polymerase nucleotidyl transferase domain-containing protein n=1 Tax=Symbiodinium natans TaxID=878477 RepID=A0A812N009_9DINO|nr:unnamed protein product [Symbiodinium natans]